VFSPKHSTQLGMMDFFCLDGTDSTFFCGLQLVELKEAEQKSLKESERLDKEIADVQELKVMSECGPLCSILQNGMDYFQSCF